MAKDKHSGSTKYVKVILQYIIKYNFIVENKRRTEGTINKEEEKLEN